MRAPVLLVLALSAIAVTAQEPFQYLPFHLTARPWKPLAIPKSRYLDVLEGVCRFSARHQDENGAIIDPFLKREHQYATPYFAYAVGTLIREGRARDLLRHGIAAMDHATEGFAGGNRTIPDGHGEFFIPALTGALELYRPLIPPEEYNLWRERMKKPRKAVLRGHPNNWETYAMKGDWMRVQAGLADRAEVLSFIEKAWLTHQRERIAPEPWTLYHDRTSDPDTLNVEAVGRGNLLALTHLGYDGPFAAAIRELAEKGTYTTLFLQDPSGQAPTNGRTDNHVWVDVGYQLAFEVMAERARAAGDLYRAGQYRHAAMLAFHNIQRWRRTDPPWKGSFYVTKNHFDPALRVGYQTASEYSNYNGSLMLHLSEAFHIRRSAIQEQPAPAELGGYVLATDAEFASVFANAGGMLMQANLRGQGEATHSNRWTPLGVVRFGRPEWDTRLGPSDGALSLTGRGVSFGPTWQEGGNWVRLADLPERYEGVWNVSFVHPLLIRCSLDYRPRTGQQGPAFRTDFVLTPDAILAETVRTSGDGEWGMTVPLLSNDGAPLVPMVEAARAAASYPVGRDEQNFLVLHDSPKLVTEEPLRGSYGDLMPVRVTGGAPASRILVYPRTAGDPSAKAVQASFRPGRNGFSTSLGTVNGTLYVGRTSAGGYGDSIDLNGDGKPEAGFSEPCNFVLQVRNGRAAAVEADRAVTATIHGRRLRLNPYVPRTLAQVK